MKVIIAGAAGRMGRELLKYAYQDADIDIIGASEASGSDWIGKDIGEVIGEANMNIKIASDILELIKSADVIIDFTNPKTTLANAVLAAQARISHIIGTTGFQNEEIESLKKAGNHAVLVQSGNMSLGVNMLAGLVRQAAAQLDDDWDIEIVDMHHRHKVDAPSGTALLLGEAAAAGRGVSLDDVKDSGRDGIGEPRAAGNIGFAALRGGSVVGDHEVILAGTHEHIRLAHRAEDRDIFARGALKAALWAKDQPEGLYDMSDVLGL